MKFMASVCLLFFMGCASNVQTVRNPNAAIDGVKRIAVLPFSCRDADLGAAVADSLGTELIGMGFDLIERGQIEEILREQKFGMTGAVTPTNAKKIGELAGVDALLAGTVVPFEGSDFVWGGDGQVGSANIRLVDTETGRVIFSTNYKNGEVNATFQRFNKSVKAIAGSIAENLQQ